jgi:hypothetical protein
MVKHLLDEEYRHAAAPIAGDRARGLAAPDAERAWSEGYRQPGVDESDCTRHYYLYERPVYLQVKVWIALRNDADHGMWEKVGNPKEMLSRHEVNIAEPDRTDWKRDCIASKLSLWR